MMCSGFGELARTWTGKEQCDPINDCGIPIYMVMTLEATIERDQEDYFQFLGRNKKGCALEMDLKFNGGKIGQDQPTELQDGSVISRLNNKIISFDK